MRGYKHVRRLLALSAVAGSIGLLPSVADAQEGPRELDRPQFGIGYIANAPDLMSGVGVYAVLPKFGGIGLYVDAKFDLGNPSDNMEFEPSLTDEDIENQVDGANYVESESSYRSYNVALVRPVNSFLMVYIGGGIAHRTQYAEYQDPGKTVGVGGVVWVESPSEEENRTNLMVGIMMRMGPRITSHFGFETQPRGVTAGLSLRLPSW